MYGDTDVIHRRAGQLRDRAADLQALADRLIARTDALPWSGRAADAMRVRVGERATQLRSVAGRHEAAADALDAHGAEVRGTKEEIARIEVRAHSLTADARSRIAHLDPATGVGPTPDDRLLAAFTPPRRGHRDWLDVELPGL